MCTSAGLQFSQTDTDFTLRREPRAITRLFGRLWAAGTMITFCLVDNDQPILVEKGSSRGYFECNAELQGISVGWSADYHQSTEGQELKVTGIPPGEYYYLVHVADP